MAIANDIGLDLTPEGRAAMERLNELSSVTIEVGYQADQKAADDETSLAEVAYWNHYGTLHKDGSVMIPARPFMDTSKSTRKNWQSFSAAGSVLIGNSRFNCQCDWFAGKVYDSGCNQR